jgi:hypothetical protein
MLAGVATTAGARVWPRGRRWVTQADLKTFLIALAPETRQLVSALRNVVRCMVPHAEESLVWGSLSYHRPQVGGRVKGAVCQIVARGGQVRLDFIHGIRLADPCGLLQGDGVSKRFVPIGTIADAECPEVGALVREAAALDLTEWACAGGQKECHDRNQMGHGPAERTGPVGQSQC